MGCTSGTLSPCRRPLALRVALGLGSESALNPGARTRWLPPGWLRREIHSGVSTPPSRWIPPSLYRRAGARQVVSVYTSLVRRFSRRPARPSLSYPKLCERPPGPPKCPWGYASSGRRWKDLPLGARDSDPGAGQKAPAP